MTNDRRKPVARYVVFADAALQESFADVAEAAYQDLDRLDQWAGHATLALSRPEAATVRRRLLRRAVQTETPVESLTVTGALAATGEAGRDVPARVAALGGCTAERTLAATVGRVVLELVRDLAVVPVADQRVHPAYRQTLRLAAELQAVHVILTGVGCPTPFGCVRPRPPEQWGRRVEDVEIAEVRSVLIELAASAEAAPS